MNNEEIKELIQIFVQSGVAEMEVKRADNSLRLRRRFGPGSSTDLEIPYSPATTAGSHPVDATPAGPPASAASPAVPDTIVKSPIVGTYYESPRPGDAPFVKVGDHVEPGRVLCIIESMKLMNEIESEVSGVIAAKLMENGRPVEYGEGLFAIRPR